MPMRESEAAEAAAAREAADAQERAEADAALAAGAPRARVRRFRHRSFAARLRTVEVDVYRRLGPVRDEPAHGAESFIQEGLAQWEELDVSAAYKALADELLPRCRTLPSVVHHRDAIAEDLLARVRVPASEADEGACPEPALSLLAMLARDLQSDFVPHVPAMLARCGELVADRRGPNVSETAADPRAVEAAFTALSFVFKYLRRWLTRMLADVIGAAAPLRLHPRVEIRMFAAGALAFLVRSAPQEQLAAALHSLRKECRKGGQLEADAAGALVSEAMAGVQQGLHSRAPALVRVLLGPKVCGMGRSGEAMAAAAERALARLRISPKAGAPLWVAVVDAARASLADASGEATYAASCVAFAATALEFNRGVRCHDLAPFLKLGDEALQRAASMAEAGLEGAGVLEAACARLARACLGASQAAAPAQPVLLAAAHVASRWKQPLLRCGPAALEPVAIALLGLQDAAALRSSGPLAIELVTRLLELGAEGSEDALLALTNAMHRDFGLGGLPLPKVAAACVEQRVAAFNAAPTQAFSDSASKARAWAALRALPLLTRRGVVTSDTQRKRLCALIRGTADALAQLHQEPSAGLLLQTGYEAIAHAAKDLDLKELTHQSIVVDLIELAFRRGDCPFAFELCAMAAESVGGRDGSKKLAAATTLKEFSRRLPGVLSNLRSGCAPLRRATLRTLCVFEQPDSGDDTHDTTLLEDWLEVFSSPLTPTNGRERTPMVSRSALRVNSGRLPKTLSAALAALMLGALRQRYSPMWATVATSYEALLDKRPAAGWEALVDELERAQTDLMQEGIVGEELEDIEDDADAAPAMELEGGEGSEPAGDVQLIGDTALDALDGEGDDGEREHEADELELVPAGVEQQLPPSIWERSEELYLAAEREGANGGELDAPVCGPKHVAQLLKIVGSRSLNVKDDKETKVGLRIPELFLVFVVGDSADGGQVPRLRSYSARGWRECLGEWLRVIGGLKKLRSSARAGAIRATLEELLSDNEPKMQELALGALGRFEIPELVPYAEHVRKMLYPTSIREELVRFSLERRASGGAIEDSDRAGLLVLLVRAMWPRLKQGGRGSGKKKSARTARPAVLTAFSSLSTEELLPVVVLLLRPFAAAFARTGGEAARESLPQRAMGEAWALTLVDAGDTFVEGLQGAQLVGAVQPKRLLGTLGLMNTLLDSLSMGLLRYTEALMAIVVRCYQELASPAMAGGGPTIRACRAACLRLVALVARRQPQMLSPLLLDSLLAAAGDAIVRLPIDATAAAGEGSQCPPVIELAAALAADPTLVQHLTIGASEGADVLPRIVDCLHLDGSKVSGGRGGVNVARSKAFIEDEALAVIEALLEHDGGELGAELLQPVLSQLLDQLRTRLSAAAAVNSSTGGHNAHASRRGGDQAYVRELAVLASLAARMPAEHVAATACAAVPLLQAAGKTARAAGSATVREALNVVAAACKRSAEHAKGSDADANAGADLLRDVMPPMCRLLAMISDRAGRTALAAALDGASCLPAAGADLRSASELLAALNAYDAESIDDEPDYDARIGAYRKMDTELYASLAPAAVLPLAHQACFDLNSNDTAVRASASASLAELVKAAGASQGVEDACAADPEGHAVIGQNADMEDANGVGEDVGGNADGNASASVAGRSLHSVMLASVLPSAMDAVRKGSPQAQNEFLSLLRLCALELPYAPFTQLRCLLSDDEEVDFFLNMVHLQQHRRVRALHRLAAECRGMAEGETALARQQQAAASEGVEGGNVDTTTFSQGVLSGLWAPMCARILSDSQSGSDGNMKAAAVAALSAVCGRMHWGRFHTLLMRLVRGVRGGKSRRDAAQVGAVATLVSAYPLAAPPCGTPRGAIAAGLMRGVLPGLQALIINDVKGGVVRAPIVMAIVRVVQALPEEADKLTHVRAAAIQTTSNALASHGPDVRDSAREALIGVARVVGAREMPQIIAALCTSLRKGYQLHVLGYTLHAILERVAADPSTAPGDLDSSVDPLVPILAEDVMGLAAEERKVGKIASKGKEARKCCSYDSLAILARSVHFSADAAVVSSLVDAVASYVPSSTSPRVRERVAEMLRALARGFLANRTASPQELLLLVHSLLDAHAPAASAGGEGRVAPREQQRLAVLGKKNSGEAMLAEFALQMLLTFLKHGTGGGRGRNDGGGGARAGAAGPAAGAGATDAADEGTGVEGTAGGEPAGGEDGEQEATVDVEPTRLELLAPFVPVLARCMRQHSTAVVTLALKCLAIMCRYPLPTLRGHTQELARRSLSLLRGGVSATSALSQECIKLLTSLLHTNCGWDATDTQLRALLESSFTDIEDSSTQATTFRLLRVILGRRVVIDSVYDIMGRVQELLVKSQHASVRQQSHGALIQFLLEYPLGPKRLRQHVEFLLVNLTYEHPTGRVAAARALEGVAGQLPQELLDEMVPAMMPPLAQRLTEDPDAAARAASGAALRVMLARASAASRASLGAAVRSLMGSDNWQLRCVGMQVLSLAADASPEMFESNSKPTVDSLRRSLRPILEEAEQRVMSPADGAAAERWREAYVSLLLVEKLVSRSAGTMALPQGEALWSDACAPCLLLHQHTWVRSAASRVLGLRLRSAAWSAPCSRLRALADAQLRAVSTDVEGGTLAEQGVKNLIALARLLHETPAEAAEAMFGAVADGEGDAYEEQEMVEDEDVEEDEGHAAAAAAGGAAGAALGWMLARVARLAAQGADLQVRYALEVVAGVAATLDREALVPNAQLLLKPVMRGRTVAKAATEKEAAEIAKRSFKKNKERSLKVFEEAEEEAAEAAEYEAANNTSAALAKVLGSLSGEVESLLQEVLGSEAFVDAVTGLRASKKAAAAARKRKRALGALLDPQADARRKVRRAEKKAGRRKRKIQEYREQRGA